MKKSTIVTAGAGIVAAAALAFGGANLAQAETTTPTPASTGAGDSGSSNGTTDPSQPMRSDEHLLTGDTLTKVTAAAKAKEPTATIERVETDSDGVYEAHMVRTDGTHIIVQIGADFAVTNIQTGGPGGHGGGGGGTSTQSQDSTSSTTTGATATT